MIEQEMREKINKKVRMYTDSNAEDRKVEYFYPYYPEIIVPACFLSDKDNYPYYAPYIIPEEERPEGVKVLTAGEHFWLKAGNVLLKMVNKGLPFLNANQAFGSVGLDVSYYSFNNMVPPKDAIFSVMLMCQLEIIEADQLLEKGGLRFSRNQRRDWVIKECLRNKIYSMEDVNTLLTDNNEYPMEYKWEVCKKRGDIDD